MSDAPLIARHGEVSYPVHFGVDALGALVEGVRALATTQRAFVVTDTTVDALYGAALRQALAGAGLRVGWAAVPAGEGSKSLTVLSSLYDAALSWGVDRGTVVVAFGGGVVGDLAGYMAATLLRGLPLVQIPTTVLSQTDSSVGGKTAVNHSLGKNLVGAFYPPAAVYIDTGYLRTLPRRSVASGLVESVKHAALFDPGLLDLLTDQADVLVAGAPVALADVLRRSVALKAVVVERDPLERGERALLNLGHTLGHAVEAAAGYGALEHGEAVAVGLNFALKLSARLVGLPARDVERVAGALRALGVPHDDRPWRTPDVLDRLWFDKKTQADALRFVLLRTLSDAVILRVDRAMIDALCADLNRGNE